MTYLILMLACQPKSPVEGPLASIPQVPAPQASWYSIQEDVPKDFLVSQVVRDLPWSEALSGAAAEVALKVEGRPIRLQDAKWAAIRAGYPYPVEKIIVGDVDVDVFPKDLQGLLKQSSATQMGVVRVRKGTVDRWVVLLSTKGSLTTGFPREIREAEEIQIEGVGSYRMLTPSGEIEQGSLPFKEQMTERGEWWLEIPSSTSSVSIPLYVGNGTPVHPLFVTEDVGLVIDDPEVLEDDAFILLEDMRERKGLVSVFDDNQLLTSFAEQALKERLEGTWNHDANIALLEKVGFVGGPVYQVICEGESVYACLDNVSWTLDGRQALLDSGIRSIGMAIHVQTNGVVMVINLSAI